jgi:hypothetical protein
VGCGFHGVVNEYLSSDVWVNICGIAEPRVSPHHLTLSHNSRLELWCGRRGVSSTSVRWIRPNWRATWQWRLSKTRLWRLRCPGVAHRQSYCHRSCGCMVVEDLTARLNRVGVYRQCYADDICLMAVEKFPNTVSELMQRTLYTVETRCGEVGLSVKPWQDGTCRIYMEEETSWFVWIPFLWSYSAPFCVGQVPCSNPRFSADLEEAYEYQSKECSQFSVGLEVFWCYVGPGA